MCTNKVNMEPTHNPTVGVHTYTYIRIHIRIYIYTMKYMQSWLVYSGLALHTAH